MSYAVVTTKRSSLKVYSTTNTAEKNKIGSINTGTKVEIIDDRVVNNTEWVKVIAPEVSGWVILKHPSVNYYYLENMDTIMLANSKSTSSVSGSNNAISTGSSNSTKSIIREENKNGSSHETYGILSDVVKNTNRSTVEFIPDNSSNLDNFAQNGFSGNREYKANQPDSSMPPQQVQNSKGYPFLDGYSSKLQRWTYDYSTDYSQNEFLKAISDLRIKHNMQNETSVQLFDRYSKYYNRFKVATPDDVLTKTFAHVFFTRPDCNIIQGSGTYELSDQLKERQDFILEKKNNLGTLLQLSRNVSLGHEFMMLPSNRVNSFECKDRTIKSDTYGKTFHGHSIAYGRHIDDSEAASEVSISFTDDRNLHLFRMHQLWVQYISDVNKGILRPYQNHLTNKELDYACSVYYIVCAENGEDIIYWSKLYGVFPTNIPDSIMTWSKGQFITNPEISITYQYSFKKDWHSGIIHEFNMMSDASKTTYLSTYDKSVMGTGNTWVGAPFIESVVDSLGRVVYKLRFRKE